MTGPVRKFLFLTFVQSCFTPYSMHRGAVVKVSARTLSVSQCRYASTKPSSVPPPPLTKPKPPRKNPKKEGKRVFRPLTQVIDELLARKSGRKPSPMWEHMPSRRGDEMRLKQKVKEGSRRSVAVDVDSSDAQSHGRPWRNVEGVQSLSLQTFNAPISEEQALEDDVSFTPDTPLGSFVEMRR